MRWRPGRPRMGMLAVVAAIACAVLVSPPLPVARAELDFKAFKIALLESVGPRIDAEIAKVDLQLADGSLPADARAALFQARQELVLFKKRVEDVATIEAIWDSMKNAKTALGELDLAVDKQWVGPLHTDLLVAKKWAGLVKVSAVVGEGVDYYSKYKKLAEDLSAIDSALMSPGTKRMAQSLTALSHILASFGDKVPLFGSLLKAYGDLAVEMTKTTLALDAKIEAREQGQLLPGVHGERGTMFDALGKLGISDAQRVDGTRDVFRGSDGRLLIWDREVRGWVIASDIEPGITEEEIIKRYLFFTSRGTAEPSPEQIVRGYRRAIVLELVPSTDHVAPGGTVALRVMGRMAQDGQVIAGRELYATVALASHSGIGEGELQGAERVKIGEVATWIAPNNLNETYTFSADLAAETAKVSLSGGKATATVRTGAETRLELVAAATEVAASTPVELTATLFSIDGPALPPTVAGSIEITAEPALGYFTDWTALGDHKGTRNTWMAPDQAGTYVFTARYGGATGYGLFGDHTAGTEARLSIVVGAPVVDAGALDAGEPDDGGADDAGDDIDAAAVADDGDAGPMDWPGTWKGKVKTAVTMDGVGATSTETIELVATRAPDGKILLTAKGFPPIELTPTPSNPRAATGTFTIPRPTMPAVVGAEIVSWDATTTWTAFLAAGKLNLALHLTIEQDVRVGPDSEIRHSSNVSDSIGVLDRVR